MVKRLAGDSCQYLKCADIRILVRHTVHDWEKTVTLIVEDRFADIKHATVDHQSQHKCECYPFDDGPQLTAWAVRAQARKVVELGTSLGYSAASFAAAGAQVYTVDHDPSHAGEAHRQLDAHRLAERVHRLVGEAVDVLAALPAGEADL